MDVASTAAVTVEDCRIVSRSSLEGEKTYERRDHFANVVNRLMTFSTRNNANGRSFIVEGVYTFKIGITRAISAYRDWQGAQG